MKNVKEILIFDFETTGLSSTNDEILEIGAIKYTKENGKFVADESSMIQEILLTSNPIPELIKNLTNISDELQAKEGIPQEEGAKRLYELINKDTLLIAYNIQFDLGFLENFFAKYIDSNYKVTNNLLDVMAIYKDHYTYPHKLDNAVTTMNVNIVNTHRALDDVRATFEVLKAFKFNNEELTKYINVIGKHPKYGVNGPVNTELYEYVVQRGGNKEIWNHTKKKA